MEFQFGIWISDLWILGIGGGAKLWQVRGRCVAGPGRSVAGPWQVLWQFDLPHVAIQSATRGSSICHMWQTKTETAFSEQTGALRFFLEV